MGNDEREVIRLEIQKDDDKATVSAILVMNGYTVRKVKIAVSGKSGGKYVIEAWKEEPTGK